MKDVSCSNRKNWKYLLKKKKELEGFIDSLIGFNGMSTHLELFYAWR